MAFFERFQATELSSLLSLVDKVQSVITENDYKDNLGVEFPDIVVCGGQSAGKSSVLQALAGVNLPQSSSITTRVALRLSLMVDHGIQESSARIGIDQALQAQDSAETFSESQYHKLGERVTTLTNRLAGPPPNETGDNLTSLEPPNINVESTIFLRVVRKEGPQMTLVDLPGISHHTTKMKDDTVNCFQRRFANSNHILLLVLNAVVDPMSQHALTLAREADPGGRRTLCVLTHIDKRFQEDRDEFLKTFRQLDNIVGHGVFPVLTKPPKPGHTLEDARNEEDRYFSEHASVSAACESGWI